MRSSCASRHHCSIVPCVFWKYLYETHLCWKRTITVILTPLKTWPEATTHQLQKQRIIQNRKHNLRLMIPLLRLNYEQDLGVSDLVEGHYQKTSRAYIIHITFIESYCCTLLLNCLHSRKLLSLGGCSASEMFEIATFLVDTEYCIQTS